MPPGYLLAEDAAREAGASAQVLKRRCRRGEVAGAFKVPWRAAGAWVVPENTPVRARGTRTLDEAARRRVACRAHDGEDRTALAREFGVHRTYVYKLMDKYPDERT